MSTLTTLRVLLTQEKALNAPTPTWIAQALEMDFTVQGNTIEEVEINLYEHILDHLWVCDKEKVSPSRDKAPNYYFKLYERAKVVNSSFFNARKYDESYKMCMPQNVEFRMAEAA